MKKLILLLMVSILAVTSCDDDDSNNGNNSSNVDAAILTYETALCTLLVDCCTGQYDTIDDCVTERVANDQIPEGANYSYNNSQLITCLEARTAALPQTCEDEFVSFYYIQDSECVGVTVGHIAEGEACNSLYDCEPGTFCTNLDASPVCAPFSKEGEACDSEYDDNDCEWGLICQQSICTEPLALGESCDYASQCGSHLSPGVWCVEGICDYLRETGESCTSLDDCYSENCVDGTCEAVQFDHSCSWYN